MKQGARRMWVAALVGATVWVTAACDGSASLNTNGAASPAASAPVPSAPLFRARADLGKSNPAPVPPIVPIVRAPDDPGIDEEPASDEFAEPINPPQSQAGGWRGFLARWGG